MNVEKGVLIFGLVFFMCMGLVFGMRTALTEKTYDVERMFIEDGLLVRSNVSLAPYKLELKGNPFTERSDAGNIEVTIEIPGMIEIETEKPPVFWQRESR